MVAPLRLPEGSTFAAEFIVQKLLFEAEDRAVYQAEQKGSGRRVALKILDPALLPDEGARARFREEARVGGKVRNQYIPEALGAGLDEGTGAPWVATELLEGESLEERARREARFPAADWDELLSQVLHGLADVHRAGVAHGALRAASVFLARAADGGQAFRLGILDFGLPIDPARKALLPAPSLAWIAPEQWASGSLSPAADVWAVGQMAFFLLTGKNYFRATERPALEAEIAAGALESASARARALGAPVPSPAFDAWFARCTRPSPAERFPDAHEALEGAADLLSEASGLASEIVESGEEAPRNKAKPPPLPPMVRVIAENPKPAIAIILLLIVGALGGGFGLGFLRGSSDKAGPAAARAAAATWTKGSFEDCKKACDKGDATACHGLGQMYQYGTRTTKDEALASQYFELSCGKNDGTACTSMAQVLLSGEGVRHKPEKAVEFFKKGCDLGDAIGCSDLAEVYASGNGVPKNEAAAADYRARACKAGMTEVCK